MASSDLYGLIPTYRATFGLNGLSTASKASFDLTWPPRPQYGLNGLTLISVTSLQSARPRLDLVVLTGLHGLLTVSTTSSLASPASLRSH